MEWPHLLHYDQPVTSPALSVLLISGLSGSGKSTALRALEDMGWYCVDNIPVLLLPTLMHELSQENHRDVAVAVDIRSDQLARLGEVLQSLQSFRPRLLFFDADDDVLLARYGATHRRHPFAGADANILEAIEKERGLLQDISLMGQRIDSSHMTPASLTEELRRILRIAPAPLTLHLVSFAFRDGVPRDADMVMDARCLPNPHWEQSLRHLDGRHSNIQNYFRGRPIVDKFINDAAAFVHNWLPHYAQGFRASLTLAVGCTGGQHRSVYVIEQLVQRLQDEPVLILVRHRGIEKNAS